MSLERASLNQYTTRPLSLIEAADACVRLGIPAIGVWRDKVAAAGLKTARRELAARELRVSSLCRGGFFPGRDAATRRANREENLRAIEEAATLAADVLVLVCGPTLGTHIADARAQIAEGIDMLVPHARAAGVRLGIEPLHPMLVAERSAVTTLAEANDLVARIGAQDVVGVVVDAYHVFWDARLEAELERASGTIFGYSVADWTTPNGVPDIAAARALMGDGCIDLASLGGWITRAEYRGPVEVEVLNTHLWQGDQETLLREVVTRFEQYVAPTVLVSA
ncbi:MAG TPA: sugar phosphate isomerase/epimerase family protein [Candidatus Acidoferrum sp.]|nr:sugar phosphate isomerase/epimerase family protein [Candidatus Acidoferrum sp.]